MRAAPAVLHLYGRPRAPHGPCASDASPPPPCLRDGAALLFYDGLSGAYLHERAARTCSSGLLLLQYQVHSAAWLLPAQLMFASTLYLCTFQPADARAFAQTLLLSSFDALAYVALFCALCAAMRLLTQAPSVTPAVTLCAVARGVCSFFSGYFLPPAHTPWPWRWLFTISPSYYSFSAIFKLNFASAERAPYLALYGYEGVEPSAHAAILCAMWAGYLLLAWLLLAADAGELGQLSALLGPRTRAMAARAWRHAATPGRVRTAVRPSAAPAAASTSAAASSGQCATRSAARPLGPCLTDRATKACDDLELLGLWYGEACKQSSRPGSGDAPPTTASKAHVSSTGRLMRSSSVEGVSPSAPNPGTASNGTRSTSDGAELSL